ncbi:MAG: carboxypeptidase regulatory-like domain-containing protein [Lentisphaeria bacterium]|nr:carboxypeptidase regulatory-like domain-containing protein [Lentisphaeria bacterium]
MAAVLFGAAVAAWGGHLQGRVTDSGDGAWLEGARIELDRLEEGVGDGVADYSAESDLFGFYRIRDVAPGEYLFLATLRGYDGIEETMTVEGAAGQTHSVAMTRHEGAVLFPIWFQVNCVKTGRPLDGMTVLARRHTLVGGDFQEEFGALTDAAGHVEFLNLQAGKYQFQINPAGAGQIPGWESHQNAELATISGPHLVNVQLKPVDQPLTVTVRGFDPVTETENALLSKVYVEATGLDPDGASERVLIPTITAVSKLPAAKDDPNLGKVWFTGLCPATWRIRGKRIGYEMQTHTIALQGASGILQQDTLDITMPIHDTTLDVILVPPEYYPASVLEGASVRLDGLKDSETEGISRQVPAELVSVEGRGEVALARFTRILPGSYEVGLRQSVSVAVPIVVEGQTVYTRTYEAEFTGNLYTEAEDDVTVTVDLPLTPTPVRADFTLKVTERMLPFREMQGGAVQPMAREFIPRPSQAVTVIMNAYMVPEGVKVARPEFDAVTDEYGRFSVTVPPGLYGVRIDGMPGYWGMQMRTSSKDAGAETPDWTAAYWEEAWPYAERWTHSAKGLRQYPNNYYFGAGGMALDSGRVYDVLLQAGCNRMTHFRYGVYDYYNQPFRSVATGIEEAKSTARTVSYIDYWSVLIGPSTVTLTETGKGASFTEEIGLGADGNPFVLFTDLPPGRYRPSVSHSDLLPRDGAHNQILIFDCPEPGHLPEQELPDCEVAGVDVRYAFDYWQQDRLDLTYANYEYWTSLTWNCWDAEHLKYDPIIASSSLVLLNSVDFGDLWFVAKTPNSSKFYLPTDRAYTLALYHNTGAIPGGWYRPNGGVTNHEIVLYVGGPQANCSPIPQPAIVHTLVLKAQSNDSTPVDIPGVTVTFSDDRTLVAPQTLAGSTATPKIKHATHPNWLFDKAVTSQRIAGTTLEVTSVAIMKRGLRLRLEVVNAATGQPIETAQVTTRYANHVDLNPNPCAPVDGWKHIFEFAHAFDASVPIWLTVRAEGYVPKVIELSPGMALIDPEDPKQRAYLLIDEDAVQLTPLTGPTLTQTTIDRAGGFLPGVSRAGTEDGYDPDAVRAALTLTWSVAATPVTHDLPGVNPGDPPRQVRDDIAEVWLIDQRRFAASFYNDAAVPLMVPVNGGARTPGVAYSLQQPDQGWNYLERGVAGPDRKVIYQRVRDFTPGADGSVAFTRTFYLPELPPGEFAPAVAVLSKMGALTLYEFAYGEKEGPPRLVGARLPPWMSTLANVFGTAANAQAQAQEAGLERFLPEGFLAPVPEFRAVIAAEDSFVKYDYELGVTLSEGSETPNQGLLGMAQGVLGLEMSAGLTAGFDGEERAYSLGLSGSLGKESVEADDFCPGIADLLGLEPSLDPGPKGTLSTLFSESFVGDNIPHQKKVRHSLSGQTGAKLTADLTASLNAIPYVGPVIRKVGKYAEITCSATMEGLTGLKVTREWQTTYPRYDETGSQPVGTQPARRHFLGGKETTGAQTTFDLAFHFGVGLEVTASERAGAAAKIELTGEEGWTGHPALAISSNPIGQWPIIKRIDGQLQAKLEAHLDYWISSYEKEWVWELLKIKHEFGTETGFQLAPVKIEVRQTDREDLTPAEILDARPQLLRGMVPFASCRSAGAGFVFIDMETTGGSMLLRVGRRADESTWQSPVAVPGSATTGAILAAAMARLDSGEWLILWSRIDAADVTDPHAPATVLAVTANDDFSAFGTVETVAVCDLPVTAIDAVPLGPDLGCVLSLATEGPGSQSRRLEGTVRSAASSVWSAPAVLLDETELLALAALGTGDLLAAPAHIAWISTGHGLWTLAWDGAAAGVPAQALADDACGSALCGVEALGGQWLLAARADQGLFALRFDPGSGLWVQGGEVLDGEVCGSLAAASGDATGKEAGPIVLAWASGGSVSPIRCGLLGADGQMASDVLELTGNPLGAYGELAIEETLSGTLTLTATFENGDLRELRAFDLDPATATLIHDDRDGDGMRDHLELHAVDDNTEDAYTLIDHILPEDDYDGDGTPNLEEYGFRYTLQYAAGPGGAIEGAATQTVFHGEDGTPVTAVSDPEHRFVGWSDGATENPRQDTHVVADLSVTAEFAVGLEQTIDFPAPAPRTYGDADFAHGATATSGLLVTVISSDETVATVLGDMVHVIGAGSCTLTALQPGDETWAAAPPVQQTLVVGPRAAAVTADDREKTYGDPDPELTHTVVTGPLAGDPFSGALSREPGEDVGAYAITRGTLTLGPNYALAVTPGTLTIHRATPTIDWPAPDPIVYGTPLSAAQLDPTASVPGTFTFTPPSGTVLNAGTHTLTADFVPAEPGNWTSTQASVDLTVLSAPLTITADDRDKVYGDEAVFAGTECTVVGLLGGDTVTSVSLASAGAAAGATVAGSPYAIEASAAQGTGLANYTIEYMPGALTVTPAPLTCTAADQSRPEGVANPPLTITYTGLRNADTAPAVPPVATCAADENSPVGDYPITLDGGSDPNYTLALVDGTLTVTASVPVPPDGAFAAVFLSLANPPGRRIWDFTGLYETQLGGYTLQLDTQHDPKGALTGDGRLFGPMPSGHPVDVPLTFKGKAGGKGGEVTAAPGLSGQEGATKVKVKLQLALDADELEGVYSGSVADKEGGKDKISGDCALGLDPAMTGDFALDLILVRDDKGKVEGTGTLTLANGRPIPVLVKGKDGDDSVALQIAGDKAQDTAAAAVKLKLEGRCWSNGTLEVLSLSGKAFGQTLGWSP